MRLVVTISGIFLCMTTLVGLNQVMAGFPPPSTVVEQPDNLLVANAPPLQERDPMLKRKIDLVVRKYSDQLRYCYQRRLQQDPEMHGRVVVKFTLRVVDGQGRADPVEIEESGLDNPKTESCLIEVFKEMIFPKPFYGDEVVVRYPFIFNSLDRESDD
jgi:hypothetical protein